MPDLRRCRRGRVRCSARLVARDTPTTNSNAGRWSGPKNSTARRARSPNAANWKFDVGTDWGNAQLEYDTDRADERVARRLAAIS